MARGVEGKVGNERKVCLHALGEERPGAYRSRTVCAARM